jgi:DNA polymerase-3 subunit epsilon
MKNLALDRPVVSFDLETTGTDVMQDRIVQIGAVRVELDGSRRSYATLVNPERPIPASATATHGITDEDVREQPPFREIVAAVEAFFDGADLVGFNSIRFDMPLLMEELQRVGSSLDLSSVRHFDAMRIFHKMEPRDLTAAVRFYCGEDLSDAHDALADATATLAVVDAQVGHYADLPTDPEELNRFCNPDAGKQVDRLGKFIFDDAGEAIFNFGKLRGKALKEVAGRGDGRGYMEWMLNKDFSEELKGILRDALDGVFPQRRS